MIERLRSQAEHGEEDDPVQMEHIGDPQGETEDYAEDPGPVYEETC